MSKSQNPMTGHMSGSMANILTYTRHGENIISSKAFDRKDAHSVSQIAQRASFKLIVNAYKALGGIPKTSFPDRLETQTPFNAFIEANLPGAIDKTGAVPVIDYSKMVVSKGTLPAVTVPTAVVGATGITLSYKTDVQIPDVKATDQIVAVAETTSGELLIAKQARGSLAAASILIPYPGILAADVQCCYLFVLNQDGSNASGSTYAAVN
jgi:hypothetical protein